MEVVLCSNTGYSIRRTGGFSCIGGKEGNNEPGREEQGEGLSGEPASGAEGIDGNGVHCEVRH